MPQDGNDPGFAPGDLTDGRLPGHWQTRYPDPVAAKRIRWEASYCFALLLACPVLISLVWLTKVFWTDSLLLGGGDDPIRLTLSGDTFRMYSFAWLGGLMGGALFASKWLYHSVAHHVWNIDRTLWRLLAPHLSAALAFAFVCMVDSQVLAIFDGAAVSRPSVAIGTSFLVGYFSDNAIAKMSDVANSLFGTTKGARPGGGKPAVIEDKKQGHDG